MGRFIFLKSLLQKDSSTTGRIQSMQGFMFPLSFLSFPKQIELETMFFLLFLAPKASCTDPCNFKNDSNGSSSNGCWVRKKNVLQKVCVRCISSWDTITDVCSNQYFINLANQKVLCVDEQQLFIEEQ